VIQIPCSMGPPKRRTKQRLISTYAFRGCVACVVISTQKDKKKVALCRDLAGRFAPMCANIVPLICQWICWCSMPSKRETSFVDATWNKEMRRTDGPRPVGNVALPGQRRGRTLPRQ